MQNIKLDMQGVQESITRDTESMYKIISELENLIKNDEYYYISQEAIELEEYLEIYIDSIHIKICMVLEYYKLDKLYNQYMNEFNKHSKTVLKYYSQVDVTDSPILAMMNKYANALVHISYDGTSVNNGFSINNSNNLRADINNKAEVTNSNNFDIVQLYKVFEKFKEVEILDELDSKNYEEIVNDIEEVLSEESIDEERINKHFKKAIDFLTNISKDHIKDEIKNQIPFIFKMAFEAMGKLV